MNASAIDVAKYILEKTGPISTMKLQKLVYYAQAWSLVWDDAPLFDDHIEAWANGPVITSLFEAHKGRYAVSAKFFKNADVSRLNASQEDAIDRVVEFYGKKSAQWLSDLTHSEAPWVEARRGIPEGERGNSKITLESMAEYYGSL